MSLGMNGITSLGPKWKGMYSSCKNEFTKLHYAVTSKVCTDCKSYCSPPPTQNSSQPVESPKTTAAKKPQASTVWPRLPSSKDRDSLSTLTASIRQSQSD